LNRIKKVKTKPVVRFIASLTLTAALFSVVFVLGAGAQDTELFPPPETDINLSPDAVLQNNPGAELAPNEQSALYNLIGVDASQPIEILLLITIISIAPSILLMMTCFLRIIIVLGFMRNAMQTQQTPPNQVLIGLALFLTIFIMWPVFAQINEEAYRPYADGEITTWEAVEAAGQIPIYNCGSLEEAVEQASALASDGDAVLLSPACASFDMFRDFEERGEIFVELVRKIADRRRINDA